MNTFDRFCTPGWDKVKVLNVNRRFDCEGIEYVDWDRNFQIYICRGRQS